MVDYTKDSTNRQKYESVFVFKLVKEGEVS